MAKTAHFLTDEEARIVQMMRDKVLGRSINTTGRPGTDKAGLNQDWQSPEVYIGLTTGVPALTGKTPGVDPACELYIIQDGTLRSTGLVKRVYNFGSSAVSAGYVPIMRDKFGTWIVVQPGAGGNSFRAILFGKKSFQIGGASDFSQGGANLTWIDPLSDNEYGFCPPAFPPRMRGEYSWVEASEFMAADQSGSAAGQEGRGAFDNDFGEIGVWMPKQGGWCGFAGECDAAYEYNRGNGNYHLEYMVVEMFIGNESTNMPCPNPSSDPTFTLEVDITVKGRIVTATRLQRRAWFNLCLPREDCSDRYAVTTAPDNDVP